jgi:hypothetical protein
VFAAVDGPVHRYMVSSAGCWDAFGQVLAADYSSPERMAFHQLVVDAYAAQHPGGDTPQQIQSVGLHLMTLCSFLEGGTDPALGPALHQRFVGRPEFRPLQRDGAGAITVAHLPTSGPAAQAREAAYEWGRAVWDTYRAEHDTIRGWLAGSLVG